MLRTTSLLLLWAACGDNRPGPASTDAALDANLPAAVNLELGGAADDDVLDIDVGGDAVIVAGYRNGILGQENVEPVGNAIGFVEAYELDGRMRWARTFDTAAADTVEAVAVTGSELVLVGRTSGAFPGGTNAGSMDAFVARMAIGGDGVPEVVMFGDERPQHPMRVARDAAGAVLVAGYDDVHVVGGAVIDQTDPLVARVRTDGGALALDWLRRPGTVDSDVYEALVAPGPAGEVIVGGSMLAGPGRGPFVRRLDAAGAVVWERHLSTTGVDALTGLTTGPDGLVYATGATFGRIGSRSYGEQDAFVVALDPATGEIRRAMQGGSPAPDYPRDVVVAADGTVYVTGETLGALPGSTPAGDYDAMVLRFAPDNTWTGAWQRGTPGDDIGKAIAVTSVGAVVGGYANGPIFDGATYHGRRDGFVIHLPPAAFIAP